MRKYIGTKLVEAEPAWRTETGRILPGAVVECAEAARAGYRVRYTDGYESWSPKAVFEQAYLPLEHGRALKTDEPSISAKMVEDFILETWTETLGEKTTVVRAVLRNGFEIVESSSCVSPENYDEAMGREICLEKIRDKVWELLGFLLQTAVDGSAVAQAPEAAGPGERCRRRSIPAAGTACARRSGETSAGRCGSCGTEAPCGGGDGTGEASASCSRCRTSAAK